MKHRGRGPQGVGGSIPSPSRGSSTCLGSAGESLPAAPRVPRGDSRGATPGCTCPRGGGRRFETPPQSFGRRGGGGTGRYQRGAPPAAPARPRYQPRATAAPAARNSTGGTRGGGHRHRGGTGRGSERPPALGPGGGTKGALCAPGRGPEQRGLSETGIWGVRSCGRSPRCPLGIPEPPEVSPSPPRCPRAPHCPLSPCGTRSPWVAPEASPVAHGAGDTARGPPCVPPNPGHPRAPLGVTPAPPARPTLGVFPLGTEKTTPGRPRPFRGAGGAAWAGPGAPPGVPP